MAEKSGLEIAGVNIPWWIVIATGGGALLLILLSGNKGQTTEDTSGLENDQALLLAELDRYMRDLWYYLLPPPVETMEPEPPTPVCDSESFTCPDGTVISFCSGDTPDCSAHQTPPEPGNSCGYTCPPGTPCPTICNTPGTINPTGFNPPGGSPLKFPDVMGNIQEFPVPGLGTPARMPLAAVVPGGAIFQSRIVKSPSGGVSPAAAVGGSQFFDPTKLPPAGVMVTTLSGKLGVWAGL